MPQPRPPSLSLSAPESVGYFHASVVESLNHSGRSAATASPEDWSAQVKTYPPVLTLHIPPDPRYSLYTSPYSHNEPPCPCTHAVYPYNIICHCVLHKPSQQGPIHTSFSFSTTFLLPFSLPLLNPSSSLKIHFLIPL